VTVPGTTTTVEAYGGYPVDVWRGGDPGGHPTLLLGGTPGGRFQAAIAHEAAQRSGIALWSFNRPGYGRTGLTPPGLADTGVLALRVADALGVERFAVAGLSGGGPFALATAVAGPHRVTAVGLLAGIGPWRQLNDDPDNPDRALCAMADAGDLAGAYKGFAAQVAPEFDRLRAIPADDALLADYFAGAPDVPWLNAAAKAAWAMDLRDAYDTYDGYGRDSVSFAGPWDIDPSEVQAPTWLWYGGKDTMVPAAHGRWLADRIPGARLTVWPDDNHVTTSFAHYDEVFATIGS
jgi:pimeloyl-ACP methyl ester carboxylesterase